jgi:hypothetical protein
MIRWRRSCPGGPMASARYGHAHRKLRDQWAPRVARGEVMCCCGCGLLILPGQKWHLGHDRADASRYLGPMLAAHNCNTSFERRLRGRRRGGFRWVNPAW